MSSRAAPGAIAALRRFARPRGPEERCELCSAVLAPEHAHLIDPANRQISCACDACAILFSESSQTRLRRVPRNVELWPGFQISDQQWDGLGVPIGLAFFFRHSPSGQIVAIYPSPAGGTQSDVQEESWAMLCEQNRALNQLRPDVEALLVNRIGNARDYFRAPIDQCYKLTGLIRLNWRGLSGGKEMWSSVEQFFFGLKDRAKTVRQHANA